jgi:hypothetical protein
MTKENFALTPICILGVTKKIFIGAKIFPKKLVEQY